MTCKYPEDTCIVSYTVRKVYRTSERYQIFPLYIPIRNVFSLISYFSRFKEKNRKNKSRISTVVGK